MNKNSLFDLKTDLMSSLLRFTCFFYKLRTNREFIISDPVARESHHKIICRELMDVFYLRNNRLYINICPGSGKSELCRHFIAWAMAWYPDSKFLYVSFSEARAMENTAIIKEIIALPAYREIFGITLDPEFSSKSNFKTSAGGQVVAFGAGGSITGGDAGLPGVDRFTGALIIDDAHKPDEVFSDTLRDAVINNYKGTLQFRPRSDKVPVIAIGQRLHEADIFNYFKEQDSHDWKPIVLKSIDDVGNILYPEIFPREYLEKLAKSEYEFAAQHQQNPMPAGGGIFKEDWFALTDKEPEILATFITADTAETDKTYNDKTVFSFFGIYKIIQRNIETDSYGLHWMDCTELSIEPKDLEEEFWAFYRSCMMHKVKPDVVAIEKKSTGVTLVSILKNVQGLQVIPIERNATSGNKTKRFLDIQAFVHNKYISLPTYGKHTRMCIEHMKKITANDSHRFDDIADTLADAVRLALIDKVIINRKISQESAPGNAVIKKAMYNINHINRLKGKREW